MFNVYKSKQINIIILPIAILPLPRIHLLLSFACLLAVSDANLKTWIVGDSIVARAGRGREQLYGGGQVTWFGKSGDRLSGFVDRVTELLYRNPAPSTIILHIGSNDILKAATWETRDRVWETLSRIRELLPGTRIIWSDILIRLGYADEMAEGAGLRCTRNINKYAHKVCREMRTGNAHVITHTSVFNRENRNVDRPVFEYDCTHPSPAGLIKFRHTLSIALIHFNDFPEAFSYPPGSVVANP